MTLRATSPAMLNEIADLYAQAVPMKPVTFKAMVVQLARSESFVFLDADDRAIAAAMLYPLPAERFGQDGRERPDGERLVELAFVCRPEISRHLVGLIHLAHSTRARLAKDGVRVRAHVRADHRPGHRLAVLCGMTLIGRFGAFDRYEFEGAGDDGICAGHQDAVHRG